MLFYTFPAFCQTGLVKHAFTTRVGGVSEAPFDSLNLGLHVGDKDEDVLENRRRAAAALGFEAADFVAAQQVHGENIKVVTAADRGRGAFSFADAFPETDALITNVAGVPLITNYADCVPVFFLDPVNKAIGLAHAGWKGTVEQIGRKTLLKMQEIYGTQPKDCLVGIAPSIGPCCYEVDNRLMERFAEAFPSFYNRLIHKNSDGKGRLDLWSANRYQLEEAGVPSSNIEVSGLCTSCHSKTFYSYRADSGTTGRMAAILMLN